MKNKTFLTAAFWVCCILMTACSTSKDKGSDETEDTYTLYEAESSISGNNEEENDQLNQYTVALLPESVDGSSISQINISMDEYWTQESINSHDDPSVPREFTISFNEIEYSGQYISSYIYPGDNYQLDRYSAKEQKCTFFINHETQEPVKIWIYSEDYGYGRNLISEEEAIEIAKDYVMHEYNLNNLYEYESLIVGGMQEEEDQTYEVPYTIHFYKKYKDIFCRCGYIVGLDYDGSINSLESYMNQTFDRIIAEKGENYIAECADQLCGQEAEELVLNSIKVDEEKEIIKTILDKTLTFDGDLRPVCLLHMLVEYSFYDQDGVEYTGAEDYTFTIRYQE